MSEKMSSQLERGKIPMGRPKFIRHILPPSPLKKQRIKEHNIENFNTKHNTNQSELMCSGSVDICSSRCDTRRAAHTCTYLLHICIILPAARRKGLKAGKFISGVLFVNYFIYRTKSPYILFLFFKKLPN